MNIALWIVQALLAVVFLMVGGMKVFAFDTFADRMEWARPMGRQKILGLGLAEIAGALGLILPKGLGVAPFLTPLAALGLAAILVLATVFHFRRGEMKDVARNVVLLALAAFVVWGRWGLLSA